VRAAIATAHGPEVADAVISRVSPHVPAGYDELSWPNSATVDLPLVDRLAAEGPDAAPATAMMQFAEAAPHQWRFRMYHGDRAVPLADLLPLLDHLGFRVIDERAFRFDMPSTAVWVHDVGVEVAVDLVSLSPAEAAARRAEVQRAFLAEFAGEIELDGFNRLVLAAGLTVRQVSVLRAYGRYMRQIGFPFSQQYIEHTLVRHPTIAAGLVACFEARFDPAGEADRASEVGRRRADVLAALDEVPSLDDDRTLRTLMALVDATLRTNAFRSGDDGTAHRPVLAFKFDATKVPDLPLPRPMFEIWVCSPDVEGVHLRNGRIARGGLRWSDRREDFRTEVLGLVKAQIVKNAVIVPTGAKGGFVIKRPPADPGELRNAGIACYTRFIEGLLDLTDNIVGGEVVPPPDTVRHDGDDPYLVVAADKGTATFSDIANSIAARYGFWLGDAFASGGSVGYDHKAMGITARGAWESVRRHAAALGKNADTDELTVVGIGDMSGDVFGNGMLRSSHIKLVAAFDHRHVFLDPDPDPASSFEERSRLFALDRSSWDDYDRQLISAGGGVHPRSAKSIELTPQVRARLGIDDGRPALTPNELIAAILRAPVDLLWNGGIGTYVKAMSESHADVGDRANDSVRVNGGELRCRMVGEGGNLGLTQRGRVEYALAGGLVLTDAIDNSAGVDCSDHEVNIKILLDMAVERGRLSAPARNEMLASMTDDVADLVLDDNRAQTLALSIARRQALPMVNVHARYLNLLESEGWVNRALESLPSDRQIAERQSAGTGLTTPEFAVLLAYTKTANVAEMGQSDLADDPYLEPDLVRYFPERLQAEFPDLIGAHRLRREIVTTQVCNQMANLSGISFDHRVGEETGVGVVDILRAWVATRDILDLADSWEQVDELTGSVKPDVQIDLFLEARAMAERVTLWLLRHRRLPVDMAAAVERYRTPMQALVRLEGSLRGPLRDATFALEASRLAAGVPELLAQRSVQWRLLHTGLDMVEIAERRNVTVQQVCGAYWHVFDVLDLMWLWDAVGALPRSTRWQTQARSALRDDLVAAMADLAEEAIVAGGVRDWQEANDRLIARSLSMFTELRRVDAHDLTTLSVAVRQLRTLALVGG
jgi:glutamate dehydrogenase